MIPMKSTALRLAPPTSAPLTFGAAAKAGGIGGLDRSAIENADLRPSSPISAIRRLRMDPWNRPDLRHGGRQAGADRPDRLIGDDDIGGIGAFGQASLELRRNHLDRMSGLSLLERLADADDGGDPGPVRCRCLEAHHGIGFAENRSGARNGRRSPPSSRRPSAFRRKSRRYRRRLPPNGSSGRQA